MANEHVNHVVVNGQAVIDLRSDTVAPGSVLSGVTFHDQSGTAQSGTVPSQGAQTITPSTSAQSIAAGKYLTGDQTIAAVTKELLAELDADFKAENIKQGVDILGLVGSLPSGTPVATGTITFSSSSAQTVTHGLGVRPSLIIMIAYSAGGGRVGLAANTSRYDSTRSLYTSTGGYLFSGGASGSTAQGYWDGTTAQNNYVSNVTNTTFKTPSLVFSGIVYTWYAFG